MSIHSSSNPILPGFIVLHGNRSEDLTQTLISWLDRYPLHPLEEEVVLAQSNGMAEWLKMEMATLSGVCSSARVELPGRFIWRTYRQILGAKAVPRESPLDKVPMTWRLIKILPNLLEQDQFASIRQYLKGEELDVSTRLLQLAGQVADLFDQYQNYRTDWLEAWARGENVLIDATGQAQPLSSDQIWQAVLWRAVLGTLTPEQALVTRPDLHRQVLVRLQEGDDFSAHVPRRLVVFGMSQIPHAMLQMFSALAKHCQVILVVQNPCRFYWGDIMDGRELFKIQRMRHRRRNPDLNISPALEDMHLHAHPLLAAWGRQGRDFVRQLDAFDNAVETAREFPQLKIDLFDEVIETSNTPMLKRIQQRIRDLEPLSIKHENASLLANDRSVVFHIAHSTVRELEVLHDQLLDLLAKSGSSESNSQISPRDIVVMVPEVQSMAPAIRAVFGQYARGDKRYIPYGIADLSAKSSSPIILAVEWLLSLPIQRCGLSELIDLLEVPAIARRFGIEEEKIPQLTRWMSDAGIRWGLHSEHRDKLNLGICEEQNTAWFGLQRMLMGYSAGVKAEESCGSAEWQKTEPFLEIGGLDAELVGGLAHFLDTLNEWWTLTQKSATPEDWRNRADWMLSAIFDANDEDDSKAIHALQDGLKAWHRACEQADFSQEVNLVALQHGWMDALQTPRLEQRFRAGGVTFCTLMPMRSIPFKVVCLLGMNDGDYPRRNNRSDFDLMAQSGMFRPGDRSRQHDDRQLMLEALLSARHTLYVSWTGRSIRDNSEQPPSVLVSQLRDYIDSAWGAEALKTRTTNHPLQPFSRSYFEKDSSLMTYVREWRSVHESTDGDLNSSHTAELPFVADPNVALDKERLVAFFRNPVKAFFKERLGVNFWSQEEESGDVEAFELNNLEIFNLIQSQIQDWPVPRDCADLDKKITNQLNALERSGRFPMKGIGLLTKAELESKLTRIAEEWVKFGSDFAQPSNRIAVDYTHGSVTFRDWIDGIYENNAGERAWVMLDASKILTKDGKARPEKLLKSWLQSMLLAMSEKEALGRVIGQNGWIEILPMPKEQAELSLNILFDAWFQGQKTALPLPLKTSLELAQLDSIEQGNRRKAEEAYEGGDFSEELAEVREMSLARMYPDFDSLISTKTLDGLNVIELSKKIYGPLHEWTKLYVKATAYDQEVIAS